jgi:hypothetical protein
MGDEIKPRDIQEEGKFIAVILSDQKDKRASANGGCVSLIPARTGV